MSRFAPYKEACVYYAIRLASWPLQWLPYTWIHALGRWIGSLIFHCITGYRKRALSNLSLATDLQQLSKNELIQIAKKSFQNLAIVCLEYPRLAAEKKLSSSIFCENPEKADALIHQGKGIVFFCGHLSNWEILFLEGTSRMKGIAIGKPIKNKLLYQWIISIREKYGGKIIAQRNAIFEGFRALKKGMFIGIVGDQGMPSSGYSSPFLGRRAWTSTAPALLAYRTNSPMITASTKRVKGGYRIRYSDPIWPDPTKPMDEEIVRMMDQGLLFLQESIKASPGEWLWQHNRWKQQTPKNVYKRFRHDSICLILPPEQKELDFFLPHLPTLKKIYPLDFLFLCAPLSCRNLPLIPADETFFYDSIEKTLLDDFRCKLVFNFSGYAPIFRHYLSLSAFEVLDLNMLKKLAKPYLSKNVQNDLSEILKHALCRPSKETS